MVHAVTQGSVMFKTLTFVVLLVSLSEYRKD